MVVNNIYEIGQVILSHRTWLGKKDCHFLLRRCHAHLSPSMIGFHNVVIYASKTTTYRYTHAHRRFQWEDVNGWISPVTTTPPIHTGSSGELSLNE